MEAKNIDYINNWKGVLRSARVTINKEDLNKEPSSGWKSRILLSEHSPIRKLTFSFIWTNLLSWVSVHFVRHKFGIEHYVRSQRTDRTGINRNELKQSELIEHEIFINAQAMINISRKRLCKSASKETQEAWKAILETIKEKEPELYLRCVPECIYRNGLCPEINSCGWNHSEEFKKLMNTYIIGIEKQIEYYHKENNYF